MLYKLLLKGNNIALGETITAHLKEGWELHGSPLMGTPANCFTGGFAQAVTLSTVREKAYRSGRG